MRRKFWPLIPVTTMQPARECHVTSLHRIRAVFTFESVDAGFADWRSAHFGQPPAPPAGSVLLFSRTAMPGEGLTAWGGPPPPSIRRSRIPAPTHSGHRMMSA
ncbi:MAG: hypothetical protein K0S72_1860 [Arthrobacter sp.]|nr:hypothetical protein [Arthrobacter sp.]